jgi:hypothetical protein
MILWNVELTKWLWIVDLFKSQPALMSSKSREFQQHHERKLNIVKKEKIRNHGKNSSCASCQSWCDVLKRTISQLALMSLCCCKVSRGYKDGKNQEMERKKDKLKSSKWWWCVVLVISQPALMSLISVWVSCTLGTKKMGLFVHMHCFSPVFVLL